VRPTSAAKAKSLKAAWRKSAIGKYQALISQAAKNISNGRINEKRRWRRGVAVAKMTASSESGDQRTACALRSAPHRRAFMAFWRQRCAHRAWQSATKATNSAAQQRSRATAASGIENENGGIE
jgi:hypothetical protein